MPVAEFNFQKSSFLSLELCPEVGNDEYLILCNFGGRSMIGFEVMEGPPVAGSKKRPV